MRRKDREITDRQTLTEILDLCRTASVAMVDGELPYVVPLSYGYELKDDILTLYFHCAKEGRKLDVLRRSNKVCFTIFDEGEPLTAENPCNAGYYYSSIIGNGTAELIEDVEEKKYGLKKMFMHQSGKDVDFTEKQANTVCVFRIVSKDFTGKRKARRTAAGKPVFPPEGGDMGRKENPFV